MFAPKYTFNIPDKYIGDIARGLSYNRNPSCVDLIEQLGRNVMWVSASANPGAIHLLRDKKNYDNIHFTNLCGNPSAIDMIEDLLKHHPKRVDWFGLSMNPNAIHLLEQNPTKIEWFALSFNPNAIHLLEQNLDKVHWDALSANSNAIHLLEQNLNKISWDNLSANPGAVRLLKQHPDKINLSCLATNPNPEAFHLLEEALEPRPFVGNVRLHHLDLLDHPHYLFSNPCAVQLIKQLLKNGISNWCFWAELGENPNLIEIVCSLDLAAMKTQCQPFAQELVAAVLHPCRLARLCEAYRLELEEYLDILGD